MVFPRTRVRWIASGWPALTGAAIAAGILGACLSNPIKDAHCSPDAPSIAEDPDCIYAGDGKGPAFVEAACEAPQIAKPASCAGLFTKVFDMMNDGARGNCAATACHGYEPTAASGIYFDSGDPQATYDELLAVTGTVGTPYVVADDPATGDNEALTSWMPCNVAAQHGGGYPMPPASGLPTQGDVDLVAQWIVCGAPGP
ncbi:MAG: hypothetical protein U0414_03955 [Polyangiaceae bacterium]